MASVLIKLRLQVLRQVQGGLVACVVKRVWNTAFGLVDSAVP
jgi:hypothetical protein